MSKFKKIYLPLFLVIVLAILLRFYRLDSIPMGFHQDEVSQAYNAFSLGTTGHDRYGEYFPILFRAFGSYQPPIYTYLSIIPVIILGNTVYSARFLSAFSGVVIVILTYLIVVELIEKKFRYTLGIIAALVVSISPWAIQFSRRVVESNLGLATFLGGLYLIVRSLKHPRLFPISLLVLGLATQAYYSERILIILFIPLFLFLFWKVYLKHKLAILLGFIVFGITQIPHLWILTTGAYARRFAQVSYFNNDPGDLPRIIYLTTEFIKHFLDYISPRNLFADMGSALGRTSPDLGVFYSWLFIPFLVGLVYLLKDIRNYSSKIIILLVPLSLVSTSLTGDLFYPLRILEFLWLISVIVALGIYVIFTSINNRLIGFTLLGFLIVYSIIAFYVSHAVLFKYESNEYFGKTYTDLNNYLKPYKDKKIVVDSQRDSGIGLRIAYLRRFDANKLAKTLRPQLTTNYYSSEVAVQEIYKMDNITVRPFIWEVDLCSKNTILVGDALSISEKQSKDHNLTLLFEVKGPDNKVVLRGYSTNPKPTCKQIF